MFISIFKSSRVPKKKTKMRLNKITLSQKEIEKNKKEISYKGGREILRAFSDPDSLVTTIALESSVTGGRGINAYKRGGIHEFRERFIDDVVSAIFWMKGVDIFNKIGDKFGEKILKLPVTEFDVGKDALRTPFNNLVVNLPKIVPNIKNFKTMEKKLAVFKFTKIILSTLLATGFVGFGLPKMNQAITRRLMADEKLKHKTENSNEVKKISDDMNSQYSFEIFKKKIEKNKKNNNPNFKGISPTAMTMIAHYLESNKICKMLSCDAGILSGRIITARNPDEGREYFFRDAASSFFYFASTPLVYKLFQKITGSSNLTSIDSVASKQINNEIIKYLTNADGTFASINTKDFKARIIGVLNEKAKELKAKELISELPFKSDVISLEELKKYVTDEKLIEKAKKMASLQPEQGTIGQVLTKQQVADVFKDGCLNTPEFMQKIFKSRFGEALTNPYKYIPMKKITTFRDNMDKYVQSIIDMANKTNSGIINKELLDKINKKSFAMSAAFRFIAIAFSAFVLGIAIPKIQYAITAKRTGDKGAPGLREFKED